MGRWLKKLGRLADRAGDKIREEITDRLDDVGDWGDSLTGFLGKGQECAVFARETMEICDATSTKRQQMMDFGAEIQTTLQKFAVGENQTADASLLETIKALTAGDKVKAAMEIAQGLDVAALQCVEKSKQMITVMEEGMDSLPPRIQTLIENHADNSNDEEDEGGVKALVEGLDRDMADVNTCVESIGRMNLSTAFTVGFQAFAQLTGKAQRSRSLFDAVRGFAVDIQEIVAAFESMNPVEVASKSKDMMRCLRLSEAMQLIAGGAGKLIQSILPLFQAIADRISDLWAALAFAKDCLAECVTHVNTAKQLCIDTQTKSQSLVEKSRAVQTQLKSVGQINQEAIVAVRDITRPEGEMQQAIALAQTMDDLIIECSSKVTSMVDRVKEGFKNLPDILTADIAVSSAGNGRDTTPDLPNVEADIAELEASRVALEGGGDADRGVAMDVVSAGQAAMRSFEGVSDKTLVCQNLLDLVQEFAGNCSSTIESFLSSSWNLEAAVTKITEMCQLVNLGELIQKFADQIQRLVLAILALMKATALKFSSGFPAVSAQVGGTFHAVKDDINQTIAAAKEKIEMVDNLKDEVADKLQFWK